MGVAAKIERANEPLFNLGMVVQTPGIDDLFEGDAGSLQDFIHRHVTGDWSELSENDQKANSDAVEYGSRVFSAYVHKGTRFWIITEHDRSVTTALLPVEY